MQGFVREGKLHVIHAQQLLVLLDQTVAGLLEHAYQCILVQIIQHSDDRQTADQLRDQAELDQIVGLYLAQQGALSLGGVILQRTAEAQRGLIGAAQNILVQTIKGTATNEQDVGGVDLDELLLRVLAAALRRHVADSTLQDLQQCLLHALAAHIAGDGGVFALASDLIDLINVDDADLCLLHVKICRLDQFEQNVLHVLAHITGLGKGGGIRNCEGHAQHLGQCLCQQGLAHAGGAQQQHVGLLQLHVAALAAEDALIVVVDRNGQHTLCLVLTDDILIQTILDLGRGHDVDIQICGSGLDMGAACASASRTGAFGLIRLVREQIVAQADALAADIDPGANDHALHFVLMLAAKAANQILFVFAGIVICHSCFSLS